MASSNNILIFGATGQIGQYITEALLTAKPSLGHITIFTSEATLTDKQHLISKWKSEKPDVSFTVGDITSEQQVRAAYKEHNINTVVSALGGAVIDCQIDLLRWAEDNPAIKTFFPSEYGTDIAYGPQSAHEKSHQPKIKVRKFISEYIKRLRVVYLVTGPYFDMFTASIKGYPAAGVFDVPNKQVVWVEGGSGRIGFTTMKDVGKFLVGAVRHSPGSSGDGQNATALIVQSFVASPQDIVNEYEKQTGVTWTVAQSTTVHELKQLEDTLWDKKDPRARGVTLRRIWAEGSSLYDKVDNEAVGVKDGETESLAVAVERDIAKYAN